MKSATIRLTMEVLADLLWLPRNWTIDAIGASPEHREFMILVRGENVPTSGELIGKINTEENPVTGDRYVASVTWMGRETYHSLRPPPDTSTYLQITGLDLCFWCRQPMSAHNEKRQCPKTK